MQGKPPAALQKIVEGKLEKYYSTVCLLDQPYVKQPDKAVKDLVTEKIAKIGENIKIRRFVRFELGEGLEKKKDDFAAIRKLAVRDGLGSVLDGTNADDMLGHRPGIRALREMGIVSPLMELGYTKARVRELARGMGLANHDRPSSPCMASRFPYGVRLSTEGVERVRQAEEFIRSLGVKVLRVRDHAGIARIEVEPEVMPTLVSGGVAEKIVERLKSLGYNYVSLDLQGFRSGSLDEPLKKG